MAALIIDAKVQAEIERIKALAMVDPVDMQWLVDALKLPKVKAAHTKRMGMQTVDIPVGYMATFSMEIHRPRGLARHLSVSVDRPGKLPSLEAAWMIAKAFGFTGSLSECSIWVEDLQRDGQRQACPNIVQFVHADVRGRA